MYYKLYVFEDLVSSLSVKFYNFLHKGPIHTLLDVLLGIMIFVAIVNDIFLKLCFLIAYCCDREMQFYTLILSLAILVTSYRS